MVGLGPQAQVGQEERHKCAGHTHVPPPEFTIQWKHSYSPQQFNAKSGCKYLKKCCRNSEKDLFLEGAPAEEALPERW